MPDNVVVFSIMYLTC